MSVEAFLIKLEGLGSPNSGRMVYAVVEGRFAVIMDADENPKSGFSIN